MMECHFLFIFSPLIPMAAKQLAKAAVHHEEEVTLAQCSQSVVNLLVCNLCSYFKFISCRLKHTELQP